MMINLQDTELFLIVAIEADIAHDWSHCHALE